MPQVAIARVAFASFSWRWHSRPAPVCRTCPATISSGSRRRPTSAIQATPAFGNENDGRAGKRAGTYRALNARYELGHTFAPDWWVGVSLFAAHNFSRHVPGLADVNRTAFDGFSFEIEHRIVKRTPEQSLRVAVSLEPRLVLVDNLSGLRSHAIDAAFKLFVDAVVIPDKLYWGSNVIWVPQRAEDPRTAAGGYRRRLSSFQRLSPTRCRRNSLWAQKPVTSGTTARFSRRERLDTRCMSARRCCGRITDKVAFNTTLQPQIAGRSSDQSCASARPRQFRKSAVQSEAAVIALPMKKARPQGRAFCFGRCATLTWRCAEWRVLGDLGEHVVELARVLHVVIHVRLAGACLQQRRVAVDDADRIELDVGFLDVGASLLRARIDVRPGVGPPVLCVVAVGQQDDDLVEVSRRH